MVVVWLQIIVPIWTHTVIVIAVFRCLSRGYGDHKWRSNRPQKTFHCWHQPAGIDWATKQVLWQPTRSMIIYNSRDSNSLCIKFWHIPTHQDCAMGFAHVMRGLAGFIPYSRKLGWKTMSYSNAFGLSTLSKTIWLQGHRSQWSVDMEERHRTVCLMLLLAFWSDNDIGNT